jgi:hypothetical protein
VTRSDKALAGLAVFLFAVMVLLVILAGPVQ